MRSKLILIALTASVAACTTPHGGGGSADRGVESVNVPVVTGADYAFDAAAPDGELPRGEVDRLSGWFQGLELGYGDSVFVDGYGRTARSQVAALAGHYGILLSPGAPVTAGPIRPGSVRVVVARRRATVPGCPNWSHASEPNFSNRQSSNYGCAVNGNLAAMIANPDDLIHGREGNGVTDDRTATRAVDLYRTKVPTGTGPLPDTNAKGSK